MIRLVEWFEHMYDTIDYTMDTGAGYSEQECRDAVGRFIVNVLEAMLARYDEHINLLLLEAMPAPMSGRALSSYENILYELRRSHIANCLHDASVLLEFYELACRFNIPSCPFGIIEGMLDAERVDYIDKLSEAVHDELEQRERDGKPFPFALLR